MHVSATGRDETLAKPSRANNGFDVINTNGAKFQHRLPVAVCIV